MSNPEPTDLPEVATAPSAPRRGDPIELRLALGAARLMVLLALPALGIGWLVAGPDGVLSAGIAVALVAGMYLMSGMLLSYAAKIGPGALMAAALGGFALRLMIYALLIVLLTPVEAIHGPTLAITAAALLVLSLIYEARLVSRTPNLYWIDAEAARTAPATSRRNPA